MILSSFYSKCVDLLACASEFMHSLHLQHLTCSHPQQVEGTVCRHTLIGYPRVTPQHRSE